MHNQNIYIIAISEDLRQNVAKSGKENFVLNINFKTTLKLIAGDESCIQVGNIRPT